MEDTYEKEYKKRIEREKETSNSLIIVTVFYSFNVAFSTLPSKRRCDSPRSFPLILAPGFTLNSFFFFFSPLVARFRLQKNLNKREAILYFIYFTRSLTLLLCDSSCLPVSYSSQNNLDFLFCTCAIVSGALFST